MISTTSPAGTSKPALPPVRPSPATKRATWGVALPLGEGGVLRPGRWRWLRSIAWLLLLFFLTAAAFGLPVQAAVDLLTAGNGPLQLVGLLLACTAAPGCYALAVRLGERRSARELASGRRCPDSSSAPPWAC
jgi:uncharacterized protein